LLSFLPPPPPTSTLFPYTTLFRSTYQRGKPIDGPTPGFENSGAAYGLVYLSAAAQTDAAQQVVRAIRADVVDQQVEVGGPTATRSEEHTSELQSRSDLVCRLLLEK